MRGLGRLLQPETIAVIGGGTWCENVIRECRKGGFAGDLWAVHPRRREIGGCAAVSSLADLPSAPDVAFVGVNRHATVDIIRDLSRRGGGGAVCFASGFSEAIAELEDGSVLQEALVDAAGDMPILGPNCYGFINALDQATLWPDQHGLVGVDKGVAIISQSSNIALNLTMQARGLPIAYLMTVGNQAQTGLSAIGQALLADDRVTAVGLHIEGIDDLSRFEQFARKAHEAGKPIVALKVGKSDQARAATVTHTASLAGTQVGANALFNRLGIAQVDSLPTLLEALKLVHVAGRLSHAGVASLSCSGGEASLVADAGAGRGVVFPPLTELQKEGLRAALGPKVALANPLDYHTYVWGDVAAMSETFSAMVSDEIALGIVVLDFPRSDRCDLTEWLKVIEAIEIAANRTGRPMAVLSTLAETLPEKIAHDLIARNIVPLCGVEEAMEAIWAVSRSARPLPGTEVRVPVSSRVDKTLGEFEAKEVLVRFGLKTPVRCTADNAHDAAEEADRIGFPVVLKGTGFSHKSEVGAVRLNLQTAESVAEAAAVMPSKSFLVEKMVTGALAELLVGVVKDPAHGFILTLAAGGVLTELLQDRVSLVLPVERHDVADALQGLRIAKVIAGYRGKPACNQELIVDAVMAVQDYVCSSNVDEVEINPLMCGENFAIAADALIRFGDA